MNSGVSTESPEPDRPPPRPGGRKRTRDLPPVEPARPLSLKDLGTLTQYIESAIDGGPKAIRAANKEAARLSAKFGITFDPQWLLLTPWLDTVYRHQGGGTGIVTNSAPRHLGNGRFAKISGKQSEERVTRARMRYALSWRARFLAAYAVTGSKTAACRIAKVGTTTVDTHYRDDRDFALQCDTAKAHAIELLHTRMMQRALEGDLEPIYWQGVLVDRVRKFDTRLQIEMARAHMPHTFKTPELHGAVTVNTGDQVLVLDEETRMKIIEARRKARNLPPALPAQNSESQENVGSVTPKDTAT